MERLRVGIDIRPLQSSGGSAERGIGRYVTDLIVGLRDHAPRIEPVLLGLAGRQVPAAFSGLETVPVHGPIFGEAAKPWFGHIPKLRSSSTLWGRRHRRLRGELADGMTRAVAGARLDVLHFPSAVDVGSYPEGEFDIPQVRTFLDAIPFRERGTYLDRWPAFMQDYYREQLTGLNQAEIVVAISRASADDAREIAGVPESKLRVVYPAVSDRYREATGPPPFGFIPKKYVLFCSVPDPHKNPEVAMRAFALADLDPAIGLVFVCPLDRPESANLARLAESLGITDRFAMTGHVAEDEMPALFANGLVLLSPSRIEGFGLPAAQGMAAGTPVLASDSTALGEIVGGRGFQGGEPFQAGGLAPADDVTAFARLLRTFATDPGAGTVYSSLGRQRAQRFTPANQACALEAIYFEAAGRSSARPSA